MDREDATAAERADPLLIRWAHLAVLWSFAFAKPLFDILADSPEFFVARENTRGDIILLALAVTLVPPTVLALVELLFTRLPRVQRWVHLLFVGLLTAAVALQLLKDVSGGSGALLVPLALGLGLVGAFAYQRGRVVRTALGVLSPAPLVFVLIFLLFSPVSELVLPQGSEASEARAVHASTPIVMVVFDELSTESLMDSRHRIDATRYPNFSRLAEDATWYRNASTVADFTTEAVPAILTGKRPRDGELPIASDHPDNLFSFIGDDYDFNVEEPITDLCPSDLCQGEPRAAAGRRFRDLVSDLSIVSLHRLLPEDLGDGLPAVDQAFSDFAAGGPDADRVAASGRVKAAARGLSDSRSRSFARFLRAIGRRSSRPTFDFAHADYPHIPWDYLPSGRSYVTGDKGLPGTAADLWTEDRRLVVQGHQRYLLQLGYVDRLLGRVIDRLRAAGRYERSLLVVTADHGVAFHPGSPRRVIKPSTFEDIAGVPLFVKAPGQRRGRIDDSPAHTIDIVPTIADHLDTALPWRSEGRSLRDPEGRRPSSVSVFAKYGAPLTLPFSEFTRRRDAALERDTTIFGSRDRWKGVFAPGVGAGLVGVATDDLLSDSPLPASAELDRPEAFRSIGRGTALLPVFVSGRIVGDIPQRQLLAVAVNGRIAGTARSFSTDTTRFEVIVDPQALRVGSNEVRVFAIRGEGSDRRLAALGAAGGETYRLVKRGHRERIVASSGRRTRIVPGATDGYVEGVELDGRLLHVSGWSASRRLGSAQRVLLFVDGRFVAATRPTKPRTDLVDDYGVRALLSGFAFDVVRDAEEAQSAEPAVRVFGVIGDRASELNRLK